MIKIRYSARKTPSGFVARINMKGESGNNHIQEGYDYWQTREAALNDASNLAWYFADKVGTDDVEKESIA